MMTLNYEDRHRSRSRAGVTSAIILLVLLAIVASRASTAASWRLSTFEADVTPPVGHPLLAIAPDRPGALRIADPLFARGLVLEGTGRPIVVLAIDWCELRNDAYARWREVIAGAANTTIDRVLISCLHQHDAPYFDLTAQRLLVEAKVGVSIGDLEFHERTVQRVAAALRAGRTRTDAVTHVGVGKARVEQIASSRRVTMPDGKVGFRRMSRTPAGALRDAPEGEIDPWLRTLSFWDGDRRLAEITSYATHPMSYYGAGEVSADFIGLARARRQKAEPQVFQLHLTGCAGDVTAGKYNDGAPATRAVLAERLYRAMEEAARRPERHPLKTIACRSVPMLLPHSELEEMQPGVLERDLADPKAPARKRVHAALGLSSLRRNPAGHAIDVQAIDFGPAQLVLLPAESFVAFQLHAQQLRPDSLVIAVGFGESAPGYIPTDQAFREGFREEHGYCWVRPGAEGMIKMALERVLRADER